MTLGGSIGPRVAKMVVDATVYARQKMAGHQNQVAQQILANFTNHVSDELRDVMGPLWTHIANDPSTPAVMRELTGTLATQRGQAWAWVQGTATSTALGGGLLLVVQNALYPSLSALIRLDPTLPLAPGDAAAAVARRIWDPDAGRHDAAGQGINHARFDTLTELNRPTMTTEEILEALRRGELDQDGALAKLRRVGYSDVDAAHLVRMSGRILSTPDIAAMWNRGILTTEEAWHAGDRDGTTRVDMDRYLDLGGEPPPLTELLMAWRRGIIDDARVERALKQSPIRFEYLDVVKSLQWMPLSPELAANSVNQGHLDMDAARKAASESGMRPEHFDLLIEDAGLPPGVSFAHEAWNRGLIDEATFTAMFLESRLKNRYIGLYKAARYQLIPQETLHRLWKKGAFTDAEYATRLGWLGYSPADRQAFLAADGATPDQSTVDLTKSEILSLFTDRAIDETTARQFLTTLGISDGEIGWLIVLAEIRQSKRFADAVVARVRAGYVAYRLDGGEASGIMDSLSIPPDQRDELLHLWDLERLAVTKGLTTAQIQTAMRKGLIDPDGARLRLVQQGYSDADADVLVALAQPSPR
jgi:hypothetical protein